MAGAGAETRAGEGAARMCGALDLRLLDYSRIVSTFLWDSRKRFEVRFCPGLINDGRMMVRLVKSTRKWSNVIEFDGNIRAEGLN